MTRVSLPADRRGPKQRQPAVDELLFQLKLAKVQTPKTEHRFHAARRWKFDLAWPWIDIPGPLAVEVDGGLFVNGGHTRGAAREKDYERDAAAMLLGYRVLRVSPRQVKSGQALAWITELLK
jgi:hypothetical protein